MTQRRQCTRAHENASTPLKCSGHNLLQDGPFDSFGYDAVYAIAQALHELVEVQNRSQIVGSELLVYTYTYVISLALLVYQYRHMSKAEFVAETSKVRDSTVRQPFRITSIMYFLTRCQLYAMCLSGIGWWFVWLVARR